LQLCGNAKSRFCRCPMPANPFLSNHLIQRIGLKINSVRILRIRSVSVNQLLLIKDMTPPAIGGVAGAVMISRNDDLDPPGEIIWTYTAVIDDAPQLSPGSGLLPSTRPDVGADDPNGTVVVIEKRALVRECLTRCLSLVSGHNVRSFPTVESWLQSSEGGPVSLLVLCTPNKLKSPETNHEISVLCQSSPGIPTVLLSDVEDSDQILDALEKGVRGYIPTSLSLDVAVEAIRLVKAGGVFVPASSLIAARRSATAAMMGKQPNRGLFTPRQAAVVEALRRGKANKVIAHELDMRESTVKVHVRNIMKKLKARNRTEVAFMATEMLHPDAD
jgi:DNA-binding NarL/FixJ family response regulator